LIFPGTETKIHKATYAAITAWNTYDMSRDAGFEMGLFTENTFLYLPMWCPLRYFVGAGHSVTGIIETAEEMVGQFAIIKQTYLSIVETLNDMDNQEIAVKHLHRFIEEGILCAEAHPWLSVISEFSKICPRHSKLDLLLFTTGHMWNSTGFAVKAQTSHMANFITTL
jgi:hypothetical protein